MKFICIRTGNFMNYYYVRFTHYNSLHVNNSGHSKFKIKPLSNKKAAELGAEMIAESLLTMIPITFLIIALNRKYREEQQFKEMDVNIQKLLSQYDSLQSTIDMMQSQLITLNNSVTKQTQKVNNMDLTSEQTGKNQTISITETTEKMENIKMSSIEDTENLESNSIIMVTRTVLE